MKILVDVHTHTIASGHAYSTITENMQAAREMGLKMVAMTDHAPGIPGAPPRYYFDNLKVIPSEMFGVRVLKGAETNIINYEGEIDLPEDVLEKLDIVLASFHPPCIDFADKKTVTEGLIKVMENPYVNVIGHPGDQRYPLDFEEIVLASKRTGTLLEVNNASLKPGSFRPGVRESLIKMLGYCKTYEVPIVLGSDAHFYTEVGALQESIELLESIGFPEQLVLNTNPERLLEHIEQKRLKYQV